MHHTLQNAHAPEYEIKKKMKSFTVSQSCVDAWNQNNMMHSTV